MLAGCAGSPPLTSGQPAGESGASLPRAEAPASGEPIVRAGSRWLPVAWSELPGFERDAWFDAWAAWLKSCERPAAPWTAICPQVRRLSIASAEEQRAFLRERLQPYRVESADGRADGLLTAYYEPLFSATRRADATHQVPLYAPPPGLARGRPWYTRQDIDTQPAARAALRGREIAWLADPIEALMLQIQGSGKLRILEPDGTTRVVRLSFAGSNEQPYRSVGRWLLDQGALRDASWPAIRQWTVQNPARLNELLWSNPRFVFFREEGLSAGPAADDGPRGATGLALTAGRSIAVDRDSVPYGTPVWLSTHGSTLPNERLVLAQDTGSAIIGAVRADFFVGSGEEAGEVAGRLKQPLRMWVLWPRP